MGYRLTGINPLAYMGVEPYTPPLLVVLLRDPTINDATGFNLGSLWLNAPTQSVWILVNLAQGKATWVEFVNAATSLTFVTDAGNAVPSNDQIQILGGANINTAGATNIVTVNLDTSIALPSTNTSQSEGVISLGGLSFLHNYGTDNTFLGTTAGNTTNTGSLNTGIGYSSLTALISGDNNTTLGANSGRAISIANDNVLLGNSCGQRITTGNSNTIAGSGAALNLISGSANIILGEAAGTNYVDTENSNIIIGNSGVIEDTNTIRIGDHGSGFTQQNKAYFAGINGITTGSPTFVTVDTVTNQLGTSAITNSFTLVTTYTSGSGTHTLNAGTQFVKVMIWGGGGGGGSGFQGNTANAGGAGGGGGGGFTNFDAPSVFFGGGGSSISYSVGAGGIGGLAGTSPNNSGVAGNNGGSSFFGNIIVSGGRLGVNGTSTGGSNGGFNGRSYDNITITTASSSNAGGNGNLGAGNLATDISCLSLPTGGGGGSGANSASAQQAGRGGNIIAGDFTTIFVPGGVGGLNSGLTPADGGNGTDGSTVVGIMVSGSGGGGGGGEKATGLRGGNGGNGGYPGGGGGGGGGSLNGNNSGAGGNGADGKLIVIEFI